MLQRIVNWSTLMPPTKSSFYVKLWKVDKHTVGNGAWIHTQRIRYDKASTNQFRYFELNELLYVALGRTNNNKCFLIIIISLMLSRAEQNYDIFIPHISKTCERIKANRYYVSFYPGLYLHLDLTILSYRMKSFTLSCEIYMYAKRHSSHDLVTENYTINENL